MNNLIIGTLFALCAAALNASIGVISKLLMHSGLNPQDIAFLKTIIAFFFLSVFLFKVPVSQKIAYISSTPSKLSVFTQIAICAFLGIFSLFFLKPLPITTVLPPMSWWYSWLRLLFLPYFLVGLF